MPKLDDPIVIAGAGPAGSTLAIRLSKLGYRVTLIERYKFPRQKLCGEFISPECLKHFEELDVLDEMLAAGGDRVYETVFYESGGRSVTVPSLWFDESGFALSLSRARMDQVLLEAAKAMGATVLEETSVVGLLTDKRSVLGVKVKEGSGRSNEIRSSLVVDATGRARVLSRLAEKSAARREPKPKFVGFKAHFGAIAMQRGVCEIYGFRSGYAGLTFIENDQANLCFLAKASLLSGKSNADSVFKRLIEENVRARTTLRSAKRAHDWLAVSVPAFGASPFPEIDGLLAVGDSAAFVDPFTGSGMLLAMESAAALAACIASVGLDNPKLKPRYFEAYETRFGSRLRVSKLIRYIAYEPLLSRAAVIALSASEKFRHSLARRTRSA